MVKKSKQQELFPVSDEERKLQENYKKLLTKEKKVLKESEKKQEEEKEFHESVKQTKEYLSWGRCLVVPEDDRKWTSLKIRLLIKEGYIN